MGSSGVSLGFLITRSYYANPSLLLQCLREEGERVRTPHSGPLLTLPSWFSEWARALEYLGRTGGVVKFCFFFFPQSPNMPALG